MGYRLLDYLFHRTQIHCQRTNEWIGGSTSISYSQDKQTVLYPAITENFKEKNTRQFLIVSYNRKWSKIIWDFFSFWVMSYTIDYSHQLAILKIMSNLVHTVSNCQYFKVAVQQLSLMVHHARVYFTKLSYNYIRSVLRPKFVMWSHCCFTKLSYVRFV